MEPETGPDGPLGELLAGLPTEPAVAASAVHPRVLALPEAAGRALVLACFADPGGARALHAALRTRIEAALLAELSAPADGGELPEPVALRLVVFPEIDGLDGAVRAFGLAPGDASRFREALSHLRGEAQANDLEAPDSPASLLEVGVARDARLLDLDRGLRERTGGERWGEEPGRPWRRLAALIGEDDRPTLDGLRRVEAALVARRTGELRWLPPLVFQALADLVAAAAAVDVGAPIEWAVCEPGDDGLAPPPLVRARTRRGIVHLPLGLTLLRWWVMPLSPGERVDSIADWLGEQLS